MEVSALKPSSPSPLKPGLARPLPSFRLRTESLNTLRLRRIFDLFDADGDGELTAAEICTALDRLGLGADPADLGAIVAVHTRPGCAGLSFDDFCSLHRSVGDAFLQPDPGAGAESEDSDMEEAFKVFDEDGDGFISARELQGVLEKLGLPEGRSIERVHQMIGSVDENSDGLVDFMEFKHMMLGITVQGC